MVANKKKSNIILPGITSWYTKAKIMTGIVVGTFLQSPPPSIADHPPNWTANNSIPSSKPVPQRHSSILNPFYLQLCKILTARILHIPFNGLFGMKETNRCLNQRKLLIGSLIYNYYISPLYCLLLVWIEFFLLQLSYDLSFVQLEMFIVTLLDWWSLFPLRL